MRETSYAIPNRGWVHPSPETQYVVGDRPYLPIDTPPRPGHFPEQTVKGLGFVAKLAALYPVPYPFAPFVWPKGTVSPSKSSKPQAGSRYGYAWNDYSPATHWKLRMEMTETIPVPVQARPYVGSGRQTGSGRVRGVVLPSPFAAPSWATISGKVVN